jgi:hypothetical protein
MENPISAQIFFKEWKDICKVRETELINLWDDKTPYTNLIFHDENSIVNVIGRNLNLKFNENYYHLDGVFFTEPDKYPKPFNWIKRIRVAFEHEHDWFTSWQEICHLSITNCDLRVLVTYPIENKFELLEDYKNTILGSTYPEQISFLVIFGWNYDTEIKWEGYEIIKNQWNLIN